MIETELRSSESVVCSPWGDLDWMGATSLRHVMTEVIQPGMEVVIDLHHVDSVDPVGVSALVGSARRARAIGCRARIRNAPPELCSLLERLGLRWAVDTTVDDDDAA